MASTIGSIVVNLIARTAAFDRRMKASRRTVKSMRSTFNSFGTSVLRVGTAMIGTAVAIGTAFAAMALSELKAIDATAKLARTTGDTIEDLLRLRHAAELAGSDAGTLDKALLKLSARLGEAKMGTGEATDALEALGLEAKDMVKLSPAKAILKIADAVNMLQTQAEKSSVVKDLFGRAGQDFLVLMAEGSKGIQKLGSQLSRLAIFNEREAAAAERFNDAMLNIKATLRGLFTRTVVDMSDQLAAMAEEFENAGIGAAGFGGVIIEVGTAMADLIELTLKLGDAFKVAFGFGQRGAKLIVAEMLELIKGEVNQDMKRFLEAQIRVIRDEVDAAGAAGMIDRTFAERFAETRRRIAEAISRLKESRDRDKRGGAGIDDPGLRRFQQFKRIIGTTFRHVRTPQGALSAIGLAKQSLTVQKEQLTVQKEQLGAIRKIGGGLAA